MSHPPPGAKSGWSGTPCSSNTPINSGFTAAIAKQGQPLRPSCRNIKLQRRRVGESLDYIILVPAPCKGSTCNDCFKDLKLDCTVYEEYVMRVRAGAKDHPDPLSEYFQLVPLCDDIARECIEWW